MSIRRGVAAFITVVAAGAPQSPGQTSPKYQGGCSDAGCHDQFAKRPFVHGPVDAASCDDCHKLKDAARHQFAFAEKGAALCFECHEEFEGKTIHSPVEQGECTTCHDPHGSGTKSLLLAEADNEAAVCAECHDDTVGDLKYQHGPVAAGSCSTCHNPHASDFRALLKAGERDTCVKCHADMKDRVTDIKHPHDPVSQGCVGCHRPHGADNKMMLTASQPGLCVDCHEDIGELMLEATVRHDVLTRGSSCGNCHDPHGSGIAHGLIREPMALCLSCHDRELASADGDKTDNIAAYLKDNPVQHDPVAQGDCSVCHAAHGGAHPRLLSAAYPGRFYAAYADDAYALCFACHDADLVAEAETDDATDFRNGRRNLHHVHVHREVKGRACGACHDPHASTNPKLIRKTTAFGEWQLPVGFQPSATGGTCQSGCHKLYRYDRDNPVENLPKS